MKQVLIYAEETFRIRNTMLEAYNAISRQADSGEFPPIPATLRNVNGLNNVCVVARCTEKGTDLGLSWLEDQP